MQLEVKLHALEKEKDKYFTLVLIGILRKHSSCGWSWCRGYIITTTHSYKVLSAICLCCLQEFSMLWDIKATPTFLFLKDGYQFDNLVGDNKPELLKKINGIVDSESGRHMGSECKTFSWVDPELPNEYYNQEVFKLLKKVNLNQNKIDAENCTIREMERSFDFQKLTMEKEVLCLQMELKEMKSSGLGSLKDLSPLCFIPMCLIEGVHRGPKPLGILSDLIMPPGLIIVGIVGLLEVLLLSVSIVVLMGILKIDVLS
ncbi:Thioredoxin [Artemisia annua]|uniref:Thioredoxin n=1 Tax=Artemisia annua TaxID=35608 RepID=A0A2U1MDK6_ARTAN|nr:Thioredoxin [Artemisia annua]